MNTARLYEMSFYKNWTEALGESSLDQNPIKKFHINPQKVFFSHKF